MPEQGDPEFLELRVHGVSGTPPDELLATDPEVIETRVEGQVRIYGPVPVDPWARAYQWNSLTSGTVTKAGWVFLLPYMLANVAGWALPPLSGVRRRFGVALVRLSCLVLTVIFSLITATGLIDIVAYQYLSRRLGWISAEPAVAMGGIVAVVVVLVVWGLTSQPNRRVGLRAAQRRYDQAREGGKTEISDPAAGIEIDDSRMWEYWPIDDDLRALHVAVSLVAVAWATRLGAADLAGTARWDSFGSFDGVVAFGVVPVVIVITSGFVSLRPGTRPPWLDWVTLGLPLAAAAAAGGQFVRIAAANLCTDCPTRLRAVGTSLPLAIGVHVGLTIFLLVLGFFARPRTGALTAPALLTMAGASGSSGGAALIAVAADITGGTAPSGVARLAEGFLLGMLIIGVVAVGAFAYLFTPEGRLRTDLARAGRRLRDRSGLVLTTLLVVTAVMVARFLAGRYLGVSITLQAWMLVVPAALILALMVCILLRAGEAAKAAALVVVSGVLVLLARIGLISKIGPVRVALGTPTEVAVTITLLAPLALAGGRIMGALRHHERRRSLAVAWDVGSFFPRWFHPFAPPPYGPLAVPDLAELVTTSAVDRPVLLACHSQGSVIGAAAALGARAEDLARVSFLTFGSPLGTLFRRFFPLHFSDDRLTRLAERFGGRWLNLYRDDDPIGGPVLAEVDHPPMSDPSARIHGGYWREPEYEQAARDLIERLAVPAPATPSKYR